MTPPSEPLYPVVQDMKICSRLDCKFVGKPQLIERFEKNPQIKSGVNSHCKSCSNTYKRRWAAAHPQEARDRGRDRAAKHRLKESHRIWYAKNKESLNAASKAWRTANPDETRRLCIQRRFRQYGVTPEWYDATLALQDGKCAICGSTDPKASFPTFHVDHNHNCCTKSCSACDKCRRGLLCAPCNTRLGILENKAWVKTAMEYLARYK